MEYHSNLHDPSARPQRFIWPPMGSPGISVEALWQLGWPGEAQGRSGANLQIKIIHHKLGNIIQLMQFQNWLMEAVLIYAFPEHE